MEKKHLSDISRGLRFLREDGLVQCTSGRGRERYYSPTQEGYIFLYAALRQGR